MKKLSKTEGELKKDVAYKKKHVFSLYGEPKMKNSLH